jgi:hypothetical protein
MGFTRAGAAAGPAEVVYAKHGLRDDNIALADAVARCCPEPLDNACGGRLWWRELDSDHAFADERVVLAQWVVRWLDSFVPDAGGDARGTFLRLDKLAQPRRRATFVVELRAANKLDADFARPDEASPALTAIADCAPGMSN